MAKNKKVKLSGIKDLDGADKALLKIGQANAKLKKLNAAAQLRITKIKEELEESTAELKTELDEQDEILLEYIESHSEDLFEEKKRTVELSFGKLTIRASTSIEIKNAEKAIEALRAKGWEDAIITTEKISKEELEKYSDEDLKAIGAKRVASDTIGYTVDEALASKQAA